MTKIPENQPDHICLDWFRAGDYDSTFGTYIALLFFVGVL